MSGEFPICCPAAELVGENLACRRGERLVFAGLNCRLAPGDALVVRGPNGSGKSSLLRLLAGLLTPAAGRLFWDNAPVADDRPRYRAAVHYIGHLDAIKPALTPREMLGFWAGLRGSARADVDGALAAFALGAVADWPCRWLSAGQRRRLALSRLIAAPAPLWLLDEPNAALDSDGAARLAAAINAHRANGGSVVVTTHQPTALAGAATIALGEFAAAPVDAPAF